jgi:WD40 repeat protein
MERFAASHHLAGHEGAIFGLCPDTDPRFFFSGGGEGWLVHWDLTQPDPGRLVARVDGQVFSLTKLRDSAVLVAGNMHGGLHWVNLASPDNTRNILHHRKGTYALLERGGHLYSAGGEGLLTRWSTADQRPLESLQISHRSIRCLGWRDQDGLLAAGCSDGRIVLVNTRSWTIDRVIEGAHLPSVFCLLFSPDGTRLWSGGRDAHLRCRDMADPDRPILEAPAHWYTLNALALSPCGTRLATASRDKTIRIWDSGNGDLIQALDTVRDQGHRHSVNNLWWSPFDDTLVSASDDRTLILWRRQAD